MKLTRARQEALEVIVSNGRARYGNSTKATPPAVYWQSADWLVHQGLATMTHLTDATWIEPTDEGRAHIKEAAA